MNRHLNSRLCPACMGSGKSKGTSFSECYLCKGTGQIFARKSCFACKGSGIEKKYGGLYSLCRYCNPVIPGQIPGKQSPDYTKLPPPLGHPWWNNR